MSSSVSVSEVSIVDLRPSVFRDAVSGTGHYKLLMTPMESSCAFGDVFGHESNWSRTLGQSESESCVTDEETAFGGSDDGDTVYEEEIEPQGYDLESKWHAYYFPSLLDERLDIPDDQDADLDFYSSLLDEVLDIPCDASFDFEDDEIIKCNLRDFSSLFDEQLGTDSTDTWADLDFYPSILDEHLDLPADDSFEWPAVDIGSIKTVRWADLQGASSTRAKFLTKIEFQDQLEVHQYPSLLDEELDIPADQDFDFDWTASTVSALMQPKVQGWRGNGEYWNPDTQPSLLDEDPIYDFADPNASFQLPVTDDVPSLTDERICLPDLDWFDCLYDARRIKVSRRG